MPGAWRAETLGQRSKACFCLCLPAPSHADRFAQSGPAADMPPDPLLATIIDTVTGPDGPRLAGLSDDQLIGVIAAARRLESRIAWYHARRRRRVHRAHRPRAARGGIRPQRAGL